MANIVLLSTKADGCCPIGSWGGEDVRGVHVIFKGFFNTSDYDTLGFVALEFYQGPPLS